MADLKISQLTELATVADEDLLPIVDDPTGTPTTKHITRANLLGLRLFNVRNREFGATGDGVTDDTAACQAAIDACIAAGGGTVYFPPGTYAVDDLVIDGAHVHVKGAGPGATIILVMSETAHVFDFGDGSTPHSYCSVRDLSIRAGVTRTAGANIRFNYVHRSHVENIDMLDVFDGVLLDGPGTGDVNWVAFPGGITIRDVHVIGVEDGGAPFVVKGGGNIFIENCTGFGGHDQDGPRAGIDVESTFGMMVRGCGFSLCGKALNLVANGDFPGEQPKIIWNVKVSDTWFDTSDYGINIEATQADNSIVDVTINSGWANNHLNNGLRIAGHADAKIDNIKVLGTAVHVNQGHGIVQNRGVNVLYNGCSVSHNGVGGVSDWGLVFDVGVEHFSVIGCNFGSDYEATGFPAQTQSFGIVLLGNDHYIIEGNDFHGMTLSGVFGHTASPTRICRDNLFDTAGQDGLTGNDAVTALVLADGVSAPGTISGAALIYVDTADGDLKVKFGDGTVKTIVVDT